ncbi:A24 family peptidase [Luedemannella helvata]|uniref:A24 family peptidase n=1 Tax=Luedemannella helvata TaxID=349315 RepID=A0ABP4VTX8_9ACTN
MPVSVIAIVALLAAVIGPLLRGLIVRYSVPYADAPDGDVSNDGDGSREDVSARPPAWRRECPACCQALPGAGWRGVAGPLAPTGRCPRCTARLGPAPWVVEIVAAVVCGLLAWRITEPWTLVALCWLALAGVTMAFVDVAVHRLPDPLTLPTYLGLLMLLGVAALVGGEAGRWGAAFLAGLGVAAFYFVLVLISPAGMGLGDVKLGLSTGTALGWAGWTVAVYGAAFGILIGGLASLVLLATRRVGRKDELPHGPFMLIGALVMVLAVG